MRKLAGRARRGSARNRLSPLWRRQAERTAAAFSAAAADPVFGPRWRDAAARLAGGDRAAGAAALRDLVALLPERAPVLAHVWGGGDLAYRWLLAMTAAALGFRAAAEELAPDRFWRLTDNRIEHLPGGLWRGIDDATPRELRELTDYLASLRPPRRGPPRGQGTFAERTVDEVIADVFALADRRRRARERPAFPTRRDLARLFSCSEDTITRFLRDNALSLEDLRARWLAEPAGSSP